MNSFDWHWPSPSDEATRRAAEIARDVKVPVTCGMVLANRGMDRQTAAQLLEHGLKECTAAIGEPDNLEEAGAVLLAAGDLGRIGILCDYDADGATSQAILIEALRAVLPRGDTDPTVVVPHRNAEGFGPNERCLKELADAGVSCVAVLDCGTASGPLLDEFCGDTGIVPVVIDHHPPHGHEAPKSGVVVNPWVTRAPAPGEQGPRCPAGLTWFLARSLLRRAGLTAQSTFQLRMRITLLGAFGTACDLMRVDVPFNRALIKTGVRLLARPDAHCPGLRALSEVVGKRPDAQWTADDFGWKLGPRINAGSRMGESDLAARCLREQDAGRARQLAEQLNELNSGRVALGKQAKRELETPEIKDSFARGPVNIHVSSIATPGTVGLLASEIVKRFGWPAVGLAIRGDGILAGSGRSELGFDLGRAVVKAFRSKVLISGGGHAGACGVKLHEGQASALREFLVGQFEAATERDECSPQPGLRIDGVLDGAALESGSMLELAETLQRLEPWGQGLPRPLFGVRECEMRSLRFLPKGHLLLNLSCQDQHFKAVWWNVPTDWQRLIGIQGEPPPGVWEPVAGPLEIAGEVVLDEWNGRRQGQLIIRDARIPTN